LDNSVCQENNYRKTYSDNAQKLRNFMYYKCGNLEKAEDFMHEAFTRLWENCKNVVLEKAKAYLFTTANRLFLNQIEHEKVTLKFEKQFSHRDNRQDPQFELEEEEFKQQLEDAIASLPESQREVFLMNRIDKMSFQEIADVQGVSLSAVHKKMYKAMDKLKDQVEILNRIKF